MMESRRMMKIPERKIQLVHNATGLGSYTRWLRKTRVKAEKRWNV